MYRVPKKLQRKGKSKIKNHMTLVTSVSDNPGKTEGVQRKQTSAIERRKFKQGKESIFGQSHSNIRRDTVL